MPSQPSCGPKAEASLFRSVVAAVHQRCLCSACQAAPPPIISLSFSSSTTRLEELLQIRTRNCNTRQSRQRCSKRAHEAVPYMSPTFLSGESRPASTSHPTLACFLFFGCFSSENDRENQRACNLTTGDRNYIVLYNPLNASGESCKVATKPE